MWVGRRRILLINFLYFYHCIFQLLSLFGAGKFEITETNITGKIVKLMVATSFKS